MGDNLVFDPCDACVFYFRIVFKSFGWQLQFSSSINLLKAREMHKILYQLDSPLILLQFNVIRRACY